MKKPVWTVLMLVSVLGAVHAQLRPSEPHARVLSFPQALARAFRDNPHIRRAFAQQRLAREALVSLRGRLLPHLVLLWEAQRSNDPLAVLGEELGERKTSFADLGLGDYTGPLNLTAIPPALNQPPYVNEFTTALLLTVPVWSWGARRETIAAAHARKRAAEDFYRASRAAVILDVLRRYEGVASARALLNAARADRRYARTLLQVTRARARRGLALPSDLLRARAAYAQSRLRVARMTSGLETALADFRLVVGASPSRPLVPAATPVAVLGPRGSLVRAEAQALRANPEIRALARRAEARRRLLAAAQRARWPRLELSFEHAWNDSSPGFRAPSNTFLATVRWPLFTFGQERGAVGVAHERWRLSRLRLVAERRDLRARVARLWRGVELARSRLGVAALARKAAEATARVMLLRYRRGLATLGSVLRAEARVERAQAELVEARYELLLGRAALRFALGHLGPRDVVSSRTLQ
jgi:outer membrane protein TolC